MATPKELVHSAFIKIMQVDSKLFLMPEVREMIGEAQAQLAAALDMLSSPSSATPEISQPPNCDRAEDQRSNTDRLEPGCEMWSISFVSPKTESECLETAQLIARGAADYVDQAAALAPDATHAMVYSGIASLMRGDLDTHLVRFINGAKAAKEGA